MSESRVLAQADDELAAARETNNRLHRRLQAVEGPMLSRIAALEQEVEMWRRAWVNDFTRMGHAHQECKRIFEETLRANPRQFWGYHSVMDRTPGEVIATLYLTREGGWDEVRVLDAVRVVIDELMKLRTRAQDATGPAPYRSPAG